MTDSVASPASGMDVVRRLPELSMVHGNVRNEVVNTFESDVPSYFWLARASENHHPPDERGLGGVWLHTKRVFSAYTMLEPAFRELGGIDSFEANCARAACLLHDGFKYASDVKLDGRVSDDEDYHTYADGYLDHVPEHTDRFHDVNMAEYIRTETELPEEVARAVECHGGTTAWGSHEGPAPSDDLELVVHLADMIASNHRHKIPVLKPARELRLMVGDVPEIDDSGWVEEVNEYA